MFWRRVSVLNSTAAASGGCSRREGSGTARIEPVLAHSKLNGSRLGSVGRGGTLVQLFGGKCVALGRGLEGERAAGSMAGSFFCRIAQNVNFLAQ